MDRVRRIRQLPYQLWTLEGQPEGRTMVHWDKAEW